MPSKESPSWHKRQNDGFQYPRIKSFRSESQVEAIPQKSLVFKETVDDGEGFQIEREYVLPEVLFHGTSLSALAWKTSPDGSVKCSQFEPLNAVSGEDVRAWPLVPVPPKSKAVVVFSTDLAFSEDLGGSMNSLNVIRQQGEGDHAVVHLHTKYLPPGSYEVVKGTDVDFTDHDAYYNAVQQARNRLIKKARSMR
ncbi:MAG: hypothetical protein KKD39_00610 [Candidatus Altiarchaeota archaeon]|nr:hypothetical protein [Candidatus Altiarchaeota archaeon]